MKVYIEEIELPRKVHGVYTKCGGEYTVYINVNDTPKEKLKASFRGLARIAYRHFERNTPYSICEQEAENFANMECKRSSGYNN